MDLSEIITRTRTCHFYENRKVDSTLIERALELSLHAPNHKFTFPWQFYWPGAESKAKIFEVALEHLQQNKSEVSEEDIESHRERFLYPEMLFFTKPKSDNSQTDREDYATLSCSIQIFALVLSEHDIAYKWSTGKLGNDPKVLDIVGIDREKYDIAGMILCGHRKQDPAPFRRPQLEGLLHRLS